MTSKKESPQTQFLFDLYPLRSALDFSTYYLNKSFEYITNKLIKNDNFNSSLIHDIYKLSKKNKVANNSFNWFTLNVLKAASKFEFDLEHRIFIEKIANDFLYPNNNSLSIKYFQFDIASFKYSTPINLNKVLKINYGNWETLNNEFEYENWGKIFSKSVSLIKKINPEILYKINLLVQQILVIKSQDDFHGSMSPQNLIGTIFLPEIDDYTFLAECFIHEALHQYLYRLEHCSPIFIDDKGDHELYYSPWKNEPRPLIMVLHGAFVFTGVILFYYELIKNNYIKGKKNTFINRLLQRYFQVEIALDVLTFHKNTTEFGSKIIQILNTYLSEIDITRDENIKIKEEILNHKVTYSKKNYFHVSV